MKEGPLALKHFTPLSTGLPTALQKLARTQSWPVQTAGASTSFTLRRIWVNFFKHGLEMHGQGFFFFYLEDCWTGALTPVDFEKMRVHKLDMCGSDVLAVQESTRRWPSCNTLDLIRTVFPGSTAVGADKIRSPGTLFMKQCKKSHEAPTYGRIKTGSPDCIHTVKPFIICTCPARCLCPAHSQEDVLFCDPRSHHATLNMPHGTVQQPWGVIDQFHNSNDNQSFLSLVAITHDAWAQC